MTKFLTTLVCSCLISVSAGEVNDQFLKALHQVESSGRVGNIVGDNGKALGPLQIHRSYFNDAVAFDSTLTNRYETVTNLVYAQRVVSAYLNRYAPKAVKSNNFEVMARIHNGGPNGYKKSSTIPYWKKVQKHIH